MTFRPTDQIYQETANNAWIRRLDSILDDSEIRVARDIKCLDQMNASTGFNMNYPIISCRERGLGYKFLAGEAWWLLSGRNDVKSIQPYSSQIPNYSDDTVTFNGAYGPMIRDQLSYVANCLATDTQTRQAVMTIWRPNPRPSKDIPCTVSIQWLITNKDGILYLNCIDTMRSSDIWLGWVYDVFNFTMVSHYIRATLSHVYGIKVELGNMWLNAGSQHLYESNYDQVHDIIVTENVSQLDTKFNFTVWLDGQLSLDDHPEAIVDFLKFMADDNTLSSLMKEYSWTKEQTSD